MSRTLAIDPGPVLSAYVLWDKYKQGIVRCGKVTNDEILSVMRGYADDYLFPVEIVCEQIASFGMAVGAEVFETCTWTGRFWQHAERLDMDFNRIKRMDVKMHLCHSARAKDANIRQALIDRLGPPGTAKKPGPTFGVTKDIWAALAVAVTWTDLNNS